METSNKSSALYVATTLMLLIAISAVYNFSENVIHNYNSTFAVLINNLISPSIILRFIFELPILWFFTNFSISIALVTSVLVNGLLLLGTWAITTPALIPTAHVLTNMLSTRWSTASWPIAVIIGILALLFLILFALELLMLKIMQALKFTTPLNKHNLLWLLAISFGVSIISILIALQQVGNPLHSLGTAFFLLMFLVALCIDPGYRIIIYIALLLDFPIILYATQFDFWKTVGITLVFIPINLFIFLLMQLLMLSCDCHYVLRINELFARYAYTVTPYTMAGIHAIISLVLFALLTGTMSAYADVKILQKSFNVQTTRKIFYWLLCANSISIGTISILLTQVRVNIPIL